MAPWLDVSDHDLKTALCTMCSSLSAVPVGRFCPISHFWTVDTLVLSKAAKTAWLTRVFSRMRLISTGCRGPIGGKHCRSNSRSVT
jgi:hypothetical protein